MSEVARLREQIARECEAMQRGMTGFALVGKHEIIQRRYEAIGQHQDRLETLVGKTEAANMVAQTYIQVMQELSPAKRPFQQLLNEQPGLTTIHLAHMAGISRGVVSAMVLRTPVERRQAQKVIDAFNQLTGKGYRLEDIDVVLRDG